MAKSKEKVIVVPKVPLYDPKGNKAGEIELDKAVFSGEPNMGPVYEAVKMYQANQRVGLASTKQRDEVDGGNKKPWKQKGTGRARVGSTRNPVWRGGGIVFGPHPRSFKYEIPKKMQKVALVETLNSKLSKKSFSVIQALTLEDHKTKNFKAILDKIKLDGKTLVVQDVKDAKVVLAARNLRGVSITMFSNMNAMDVLKHKNLLITEKGLEQLTKKLKG